jgi:hypothetical protein
MHRTNLADPDREPTDEELGELIREAFAHVAKANEESLSVLRAQINAQRAKVLEEFSTHIERIRHKP